MDGWFTWKETVQVGSWMIPKGNGVSWVVVKNRGERRTWIWNSDLRNYNLLYPRRRETEEGKSVKLMREIDSLKTHSQERFSDPLFDHQFHSFPFPFSLPQTVPVNKWPLKICVVPCEIGFWHQSVNDDSFLDTHLLIQFLLPGSYCLPINIIFPSPFSFYHHLPLSLRKFLSLFISSFLSSSYCLSHPLSV